MNPKPETPNARLKVLLIEDNPGDARLIQEMMSDVEGTSFELEWAGRLSKGLEHLKAWVYDVILLDLSLPDSHGIDTFRRVHAIAPEVPIVVLSGLADESVAFKTVREGAQDYLIKGQVNAFLLKRSIRYALERERLLRELKDAFAKISTLSGLLPICASCKSIRDDKGYWTRVEDYIEKHTSADFTHGICPACVKKLYPQLTKDNE